MGGLREPWYVVEKDSATGDVFVVSRVAFETGDQGLFVAEDQAGLWRPTEQQWWMDHPCLCVLLGLAPEVSAGLWGRYSSGS